MNLKSLLATAMVVLLLVSCTKEVIVEKEVPTETETGTTFINVGLTSGGVKVKSADDHYGTEPTDEELLIYNYSVFIFNSNGILEATLLASPYSVTNGTPALAYDRSYALEFDPTYESNSIYMNNDGAVRLAAGTKTIFALVNAPKKLLEESNAFVGNPSLRLAVAQDEPLTIDGLQTIVGKYLLEDGTEILDDDIEDDQVAGTTGTGNRGFMMTSLEVNGVYYGEKEENNPHPVTLEVGRAMGKVSVATDLVPGDINTQPNGNLEALQYKIINNPKSMFIMPKFSGDVPVSPYFYANSVTTSNYAEFMGYLDISVENNRTNTYFIENSNLYPKKGNSTAAIIQGIFTPISLVDENGSNPTANYNNPYSGALGSGTFYRIKNNETGEFTYKGNDLYYYEEPVIDPADVNDYTVIVYPEGVCYYPVYLTNKDAAAPYCPKRNSYYRINIEYVSGAGEADEDDLIPDPEEPIDAQTYIEVSIDVKDWDPVDQPGIL